MTLTIHKTVTVGAGGVIEVSAPELHEGDQAKVTVEILHPAADSEPVQAGDWREYAGAFSGKDANGGDNDRIDADLARQYQKELQGGG